MPRMRGKTLYWTAAAVVLLPVAALAMMSVFSKRPSSLGVSDGRLSGCPDSPNCVSTESSDPEHQIQPIAFEGPPEQAMERIKAALATLPRTKIVTESTDYLHAEATSLLFRFVDDVEFLVDAETGMVHMRSASRAGRSDFGVNRGRMERIREAFLQSATP